MTALLPDTASKIERLQIELLRQMPSWCKMTLMAGMCQTVRSLAMAGLRQRYPGDTVTQRHRRPTDLLPGPELATRAYGPLSEES